MNIPTRLLLQFFLCASLCSCGAFSWLLYGSPVNTSSDKRSEDSSGGDSKGASKPALGAVIVPSEILLSDGVLRVNAYLNRQAASEENPQVYLLDEYGSAIISLEKGSKASLGRSFEGGVCGGIKVIGTGESRPATREFKEGCAWNLGKHPISGNYVLEVRSGDRVLMRQGFTLEETPASGGTTTVGVKMTSGVLHPYFAPAGLGTWCFSSEEHRTASGGGVISSGCEAKRARKLALNSFDTGYLVVWLPADARYESRTVRLDVFAKGEIESTEYRYLGGPRLTEVGQAIVQAMPVVFQSLDVDAGEDRKFSLSTKGHVLGTWLYHAPSAGSADKALAASTLSEMDSPRIEAVELSVEERGQLEKSLISGGGEKDVMRLRGRTCAVMLKETAAEIAGRMARSRQESGEEGAEASSQFARWDLPGIKGSLKTGSSEYKKLARRLDSLGKAYRKSGCWRGLATKLPVSLK